jgi:hypothetical protein
MQWLVGLIVERFLRALLDWLKALWDKNQAEQKRNEAIDKRTGDQAKKLKESETDEEDEAAARDILNRNN